MTSSEKGSPVGLSVSVAGRGLYGSVYRILVRRRSGAKLLRPEPLQRKEALWGYLFLLPAVVFMGVFIVYSSAVGLVRSFYDWNLLSLDRWRFTGIENYVRMFSDGVFLLTARNLVAVLMGKLVIQAGGGLILAAIVNNLKSLGLRRMLRTLYFMPAVVAPVAVGLIWAYIFEPEMGLVTRFFALLGVKQLAVAWLGSTALSLPAVIVVDTWQNLSFPFVLFLAGMQAIPEELYEAAKIDGANSLQLFRHITIPGLRRMISVVVIINTINAIKLFDIVRAMTRGGPNHHSDTPASWLFQVGLEQHDLGYACAMAVLIVAVCLVLTLIELRVLERSE